MNVKTSVKLIELERFFGAVDSSVLETAHCILRGEREKEKQSEREQKENPVPLLSLTHSKPLVNAWSQFNPKRNKQKRLVLYASDYI